MKQNIPLDKHVMNFGNDYLSLKKMHFRLFYCNNYNVGSGSVCVYKKEKVDYSGDNNDNICRPLSSALNSHFVLCSFLKPSSQLGIFNISHCDYEASFSQISLNWKYLT